LACRNLSLTQKYNLKDQPMDAGIIMSFKRNYRRYHIQWMLKQVEDGMDAQDLKMDILQAIKYIIQGWNEVIATTIKNCWRHTNLIPYWDNPADSEESEDEVSLEDPLLEELSKNIEDLNFSNPMRVEEYLNNPDEDIVYEIPDDDQIISDLVETFGERSDEIENNPEEVDDSVEEEIISPNDALKSLENIRTFLFQQESASEYINLVSVIEKFINVKKKDSMKQSTISRYFNEVSQSTDQDDWMEIFA